MDEKTTSTLTEVLQKISPDNIAEYFFENEKYCFHAVDVKEKGDKAARCIFGR